MFEKLILSFEENFGIVSLVIAILCFVIPMIYTVVKRKKRKIKSDALDKRRIMIDSGISTRIGLILFLLIFFIITGIIVIYLAINKSENTFNMVFGIITGIAICLIPIIISFKTIKEAIKVLNREYVIVLDELMDKYYYRDLSYRGHGEGIDRSGWQLYFKDFFKTYDKYIKFRDLKEGREYKEGDKFYLVFIKGNNIPYMFAANEYTLAPSEENKLKTIDEAKEYINLNEFVLEEVQNDKIVINKKRIIEDFFDKSQKQTIIFNITVTLGLLFLGIIIYNSYFNLVALIMILFMFVCFLIMSIVKIKYISNVIKNIKNNEYKIKEDEVISLNNGIRYSDSNRMISFKFKNYKKIVYADKKYYTDVSIGDKLYLVFVKCEKEPIKVYSIKNSILEKNEF